jgi:hypothetical protein
MEVERISVAEAARRLGISPRAARFRIERGELSAEKKDGMWIVVWPPDLSGKSLKPLAEQLLPRKPLPNKPGVSPRKPNVSLEVPQTANENAPRYAKELSSLAAFRILRDVFGRLPDTPECVRHRHYLHGALREVTRGYYQWRREAKLHCYNEARNWVADAMLELILRPLSDARLTAALVGELEHDALAALVGLSRRFERKGRKEDEPLTS